MPLNIGYLKAKTDKASDEVFTPKYAVLPLVKYIPNGSTIQCPFDTLESEYVKVFTENGYKVIHSHIDEGKNFFEYEPKEYDIIISNPPFSIKDDIIKHLYELDKPYAMLLPIPTLQGQKRFEYIKDGLQILSFNKRINFYTDSSRKEIQKGVSFGCAYFCKNFLPKDLILEELKNQHLLTTTKKYYIIILQMRNQ